MQNQEKDNKNKFITTVCIRMFQINRISFLQKKNSFFILFEPLLFEQISLEIKISKVSWLFFEG